MSRTSYYVALALIIGLMITTHFAIQRMLDANNPPKKEKPVFAGAFAGRRSGQATEGGRNPESERAVALGLAWLAQQQKDDGSWEFDGSAKEDQLAATGLALLTFLGAGETHTDARKYQETVSKGLKFLLSLQRNNGDFKSNVGNYMYGHGIATLALCEAYGMTRDKELHKPAWNAINVILRAQGPNGGWRYPAQPVPGDMSVTGWQVQALNAARCSKTLVVDDATIRKINDFLDSVSAGPNQALYGYTIPPMPPHGAGTSMTAVGLYCRRCFSNWDSDTPGMKEGVEGLLKKRPKPGTKQKPALLDDLYFCYYATQVMYHSGGNEWRDWNEGPLVDGKRNGGMREWLVWTQIIDDKNAGSWEPDRGHMGGACGRLGTTCMAVLTLEVYYRYVALGMK